MIQLDTSAVDALAKNSEAAVEETELNRRIDVSHVADELRSRVPAGFGEFVMAGNSPEGAFIGYAGGHGRIMQWLDFGGTLRPSGGRHNTQRRLPAKHSRYMYPVIRPHFQEMADGAAQELAVMIEGTK